MSGLAKLGNIESPSTKLKVRGSLAVALGKILTPKLLLVRSDCQCVNVR